MDMMWYRRRGLMVTPHIERVTGAIASFNSDYNKISVKSLICDIEAIQEGTGDPSPENVRPISGRTGLSVVRTGKNLLPYTEQGAYKTTDGLPILANSYVRSPKIIAKPNVTYWVSSSVASVACIFWDVNGNYISGSDYATIASRHWDAPTNAHYVAFNFYSNTGNITPETVGNIMVNVGSVFADYEPYKGSTYSVNWESAAGTVYGGYVDVVSGKLIVDRGYIASYNGETLPSTWISDRDVYSAGTTPTTGAQVVYELATPTEIQLTPQEVRTLLGENNIWCDSGDVSVDYWKWGK